MNPDSNSAERVTCRPMGPRKLDATNTNRTIRRRSSCKTPTPTRPELTSSPSSSTSHKSSVSPKRKHTDLNSKDESYEELRIAVNQMSFPSDRPPVLKVDLYDHYERLFSIARDGCPVSFWVFSAISLNPDQVKEGAVFKGLAPNLYADLAGEYHMPAVVSRATPPSGSFSVSRCGYGQIVTATIRSNRCNQYGDLRYELVPQHDVELLIPVRVHRYAKSDLNEVICVEPVEQYTRHRIATGSAMDVFKDASRVHPNANKLAKHEVAFWNTSNQPPFEPTTRPDVIKTDVVPLILFIRMCPDDTLRLRTKCVAEVNELLISRAGMDEDTCSVISEYWCPVKELGVLLREIAKHNNRINSPIHGIPASTSSSSSSEMSAKRVCQRSSSSSSSSPPGAVVAAVASHHMDD